MTGPGPNAKVYRGPAPKPEPDRLEQYLEFWRRLAGGGTLEKWYPGRSVGLVGGGASESFDDLCDRAEGRIAEVMDVLIYGDATSEGLPEPQKRALMHKYQYAVFNYRDHGAFSRALMLAKESLRIGLKKRHLL